jgi:membrane-associated protease RseP (regulator of RpoE activity)
MDPLARSRPRFPTLQVVLFGATVLTTVTAGALLSPQADALAAAAGLAEAWPVLPAALAEGLRFSAALIAILLAHELGHLVTARRHGVDATWPYFIPLPFGVGTLGAVIRMRSPIPTRRAALDIGASGPLAGFVVAIPILLWGLAHSEVQVAAALGAAPPFAPSPLAMAWRLLHGEAALPPGSDLMVFGDSLVLRGAQRLVLGELPPGSEVLIHPVALAAWFGLLVTTLNLIPIGQLDGGHVTYALLGERRARRVGQAASWALLAAGLTLTWSWLPWWVITRWLIGFRHPPPLVEEPRLGTGRALVALASLAVLIGTFVPVPVSL